MMIFVFVILIIGEISHQTSGHDMVNHFLNKAENSFNRLKRFPRHNAKINSYRWHGGIVPYRIDMSNYSKLAINYEKINNSFFIATYHVNEINKAIEIIENSTCIKFVNHTNETDFVTITGNSYHCGTKIGRRGGEHILSLLDTAICFRTTSIIHEFLHILGFHHMHLSANRDDFIQIIWENVQPEKFKKFKIRRDLQDLGVEYDYGSIMHYSEYAYSKNGEKTIVPLRNVDSHVIIGQREKLSDKDILRINRLYNCELINEIF